MLMSYYLRNLCSERRAGADFCLISTCFRQVEEIDAVRLNE
jgi:hypothetical protein